MSPRISLTTVRSQTSSVPDAARTGMVVSSALITLFFTVSATWLICSAVVGTLLLLASESPEQRVRRRAAGPHEPDSLRPSLGRHATSMIVPMIIGLVVVCLAQVAWYTLAFLTVVVLALAALAAQAFLEIVERAQNRASSWLKLPEGFVEAKFARWAAWAAPGEGRQ